MVSPGSTELERALRVGDEGETDGFGETDHPLQPQESGKRRFNFAAKITPENDRKQKTRFKQSLNQDSIFMNAENHEEKEAEETDATDVENDLLVFDDDEAQQAAVADQDAEVSNQLFEEDQQDDDRTEQNHEDEDRYEDTVYSSRQAEMKVKIARLRKTKVDIIDHIKEKGMEWTQSCEELMRRGRKQQDALVSRVEEEFERRARMAMDESVIADECIEEYQSVYGPLANEQCHDGSDSVLLMTQE